MAAAIITMFRKYDNITGTPVTPYNSEISSLSYSPSINGIYTLPSQSFPPNAIEGRTVLQSPLRVPFGKASTDSNKVTSTNIASLSLTSTKSPELKKSSSFEILTLLDILSKDNSGCMCDVMETNPVNKSNQSNQSNQSDDIYE